MSQSASNAEEDGALTGGRITAIDYSAQPGSGHERILNLGGLQMRATCIETDDGFEYLSVAARTEVDNAARAASLTLDRSGEPQTYGFSSSDFDRDYGWYDVAGTIPEPTSGTFSYARPGSGQVAVTFTADQDGSCTFTGTATFAHAPVNVVASEAAPLTADVGARLTRCPIGTVPEYFVPGGGSALIAGCAELALSTKPVEFSIEPETIGRRKYLCINPAYNGRGQRGIYIPATCVPVRNIGFEILSVSQPSQAVQGFDLVVWGTAPAAARDVRIGSVAGGTEALSFTVTADLAQRVGVDDPFQIFVAELPVESACGDVTARASAVPEVPATRERPAPKLCPS